MHKNSKSELLCLKQYISSEALAERWRVHRSTVERRLRAAGVYPVSIGRAKRFELSEVEKFFAANMPPSRGRRPLL